MGNEDYTDKAVALSKNYILATNKLTESYIKSGLCEVDEANQNTGATCQKQYEADKEVLDGAEADIIVFRTTLESKVATMGSALSKLDKAIDKLNAEIKEVDELIDGKVGRRRAARGMQDTIIEDYHVAMWKSFVLVGGIAIAGWMVSRPLE